MGNTGRAIFLDRDGTIIEHVPYLHDPGLVNPVPGAAGALRQALEAGFQLFLFTNQSGVGRGMFRMEDVEACNARMLELLNLPAPGFRGVCIAPEAPGEAVCYRKPSPRFIEEMIRRHHLDRSACWMVGDSEADRLAAENAGIAFKQVGPGSPLPAAVGEILGAGDSCSGE